jgi:primosomal protein N'
VVLGPSPAPIARVKDAWRWQTLLKAPVGSDIASVVREGLARTRIADGVSAAPDVDPVDML